MIYIVRKGVLWEECSSKCNISGWCILSENLIIWKKEKSRKLHKYMYISQANFILLWKIQNVNK